MVFSNYSETQKEELAVSLACMLLNDGDVEVNATNINSVNCFSNFIKGIR